QDGGDRLRRFIPDDLLDVVDAGTAADIGGPAEGTAVAEGIEHADHTRHPGLERMAPWIARGRQGPERRAVIAAVPRHDLRSAGREPRDLDRVLVRVRA